MDVNDLKGLFAEVKTRMDAGIERVRRDLANVRTGRASVGMLDAMHVEAYGARMPLNQVASLSIPEPSLIVAQPFDPSLMGAIEKAIRSSDLGLNPSNDGKVIRVPIPALTEDRRKELSRHVHKQAEEGPQRAAHRPPRRQRAAEEAAQGPPDLRGRRAARPRRSAEDHRPAHQDRRRTAEEEGPGPARALTRAEGGGRRRRCAATNWRDAWPRSQLAQPPAASRHPSNPMSFFSHLECSRPCGAGPFDPRERHHLCACGAPLLARYDLARARAWRRESLRDRVPTMWRYRELLPVFDGEQPVTLGEGFTPLFHARASARRSGSIACTSRTNRSTRRTRSRRAGSPRR